MSENESPNMDSTSVCPPIPVQVYYHSEYHDAEVL